MIRHAEAIIFDLDGTLINSLADIADCMNLALEELGLPPHDWAAYRSFVGEGAERLAERSVGARQDLKLRVLERYKSIYEASPLTRTLPYDGIPELLSRLEERQARMAVLSNKPHASTIHIVERAFGQDVFGRIYGQRSGIPRKPDPAAALEIARELGADPGATLFVGDTAIDMRTAKAAGMLGVGVLWGFRDKVELVEHGARLLISRPGELIEKVSGLPIR